MFASRTSVVAISAFALIVSGCMGKNSSSPSSGTTDDSGGGGGGSSELTSTALTDGTGQYGYSVCIPVNDNTTYGSAFGTGNYSILKTVFFSGSDYSLSADVFYGSTQECQRSTGVTEVFAYTQAGVYSVGSATTTPSGGYAIEYTATSSSLTAYGGAASGFSNTWVQAINSACGTSFTPTATSGIDTNIAGVHCNANGIEINFPSLGSFYDVIVPSSLSSPSSIDVYSNNFAFEMGQTSTYPSSATQSLTN